MAAGSAAIGYAGAQQQGMAEENAANYNAAIGRQNAKFAIEQASMDEAKTRMMGKKITGQARANVAASGIQMEGSALDVLEESASNIEMDALTIRHNGALKAWAYEAGAALDIEQGKNARMAANFKGASVVLEQGEKAATQAFSGGKSGGKSGAAGKGT